MHDKVNRHLCSVFRGEKISIFSSNNHLEMYAYTSQTLIVTCHTETNNNKSIIKKKENVFF